MTFIQEFLMTVLPNEWAENIRAESFAWMMQCACGFERSVWESGGIRWKAKGTPRRLLVCPSCGQRTFHTIYRKSGG
jgi:hypothetical protein